MVCFTFLICMGGVHKWGLHFKKVVHFNYLGDCILKRGSHLKKVVQFN